MFSEALPGKTRQNSNFFQIPLYHSPLQIAIGILPFFAPKIREQGIGTRGWGIIEN
jgi:hypothetical protein